MQDDGVRPFPPTVQLKEARKQVLHYLRLVVSLSDWKLLANVRAQDCPGDSRRITIILAVDVPALGPLLHLLREESEGAPRNIKGG
jgi:hypothetical protein